MTYFVSEIGVCESRFSTLLKPRGHNPPIAETSQRSGKVVAPFPPHTTDMMSFSLWLQWAAILVCAESLLMGFPRWCADRTLERRSLFGCQHVSGSPPSSPVSCWPPRPSASATRRVHGQDALLMTLVENEVRSVCSIFCFCSRPSVLKLWLCGHR